MGVSKARKSALQYQVRRAGPQDFALLRPLFERFYREEGFDAEALAGVAGNLRQLLLRDDTAAFIALTDGQAVGAAAASRSFGLEVGLYAELEDIFVDPLWRGKGIATALVEAVCGWAKAQDCVDIEIVMTPYAHAKSGLRVWYEARGFENSHRMTFERSLR